MVAKVTVVKADKSFELMRCDILVKMIKSVQWCLTVAGTDKLPAVKSFCGLKKIKQDAKAMFGTASKFPLPLERNISQLIEDLSSSIFFCSRKSRWC